MLSPSWLRRFPGKTPPPSHSGCTPQAPPDGRGVSRRPSSPTAPRPTWTSGAPGKQDPPMAPLFPVGAQSPPPSGSGVQGLCWVTLAFSTVEGWAELRATDIAPQPPVSRRRGVPAAPGHPGGGPLQRGRPLPSARRQEESPVLPLRCCLQGRLSPWVPIAPVCGSPVGRSLSPPPAARRLEALLPGDGAHGV